MKRVYRTHKCMYNTANFRLFTTTGHQCVIIRPKRVEKFSADARTGQKRFVLIHESVCVRFLIFFLFFLNLFLVSK